MLKDMKSDKSDGNDKVKNVNKNENCQLYNLETIFIFGSRHMGFHDVIICFL